MADAQWHQVTPQITDPDLAPPRVIPPPVSPVPVLKQSFFQEHRFIIIVVVIIVLITLVVLYMWFNKQSNKKPDPTGPAAAVDVNLEELTRLRELRRQIKAQPALPQRVQALQQRLPEPQQRPPEPQQRPPHRSQQRQDEQQQRPPEPQQLQDDDMATLIDELTDEATNINTVQ